MAKKGIFRGFLRTDHSNLVPENFSEDFRYTIWIESMFQWIRSINRTNSWDIWTRICEDMVIFKTFAHPPLKQNPMCWLKLSKLSATQIYTDSWSYVPFRQDIFGLKGKNILERGSKKGYFFMKFWVQNLLKKIRGRRRPCKVSRRST